MEATAAVWTPSSRDDASSTPRTALITLKLFEHLTYILIDNRDLSSTPYTVIFVHHPAIKVCHGQLFFFSFLEGCLQHGHSVKFIQNLNHPHLRACMLRHMACFISP